MRNKCILLFLLIPLALFSQRIKTLEVVKTSDSILQTKVGERIFKCFKISEGSYYKFKNSSTYESYGKFLSKKALKKNTTEIWVLYSFRSDDLIAGLWVKLDSELKLIEDLELNFIPEFLKNDKPSNFITYQNAKQIAIDSFKKPSIGIEEPKLIFEDKKDKYIYRVISMITKIKINGKDTGETEIIEIDALDGKILNISKGYYGLMIR